MKTKHWIIIVVKHKHLETPFIVPQLDFDIPMVFPTEALADAYNESVGGIVFEYTLDHP
jgi:hypothetical protein